MPGLIKAQQLFLQAFMSGGLLGSQDVKKALKLACQMCSLDPDQANLVDWVRTINTQLAPLHLEIKKAVSEDKGSPQYYGLTSTAETDISRLSTSYSENEYEFLKKIVELVVESDVGHVSSTECLLVVGQLERTMQKAAAEELIERLKKDGWLVGTEEGRVYLSTRCILELDQYIHEQFPDAAIDCNVCNRLCIRGQMCDRCDVKLHTTCAARFFSEATEPKCPNDACKTPWAHEVPVYARAANKDTESPVRNSQPERSQANPRKRRATQQ